MKYLRRKTILLFSLLVFIKCVTGQTCTYRSLMDELGLKVKECVPDKRTGILDLTFYDTLSSRLILLGETDQPEAKAHIISWLTENSFSVVDSVRILPDSVVGKKKWALSCLSVSNLRYIPDHAAELVSQVVMGTPLKILDLKDKWYRIQTPEGYIGWMDASGLTLLTLQELTRWKDAKRMVYNRMNGYAYLEPDIKSPVVSDLVLCNIFETETEVKNFFQVLLPDGRKCYVLKEECRTYNAWISQTTDAQALIAVALRMMGTPYLWGGTSGKAVDCSGFIKMIYYASGVILARDASQQARFGTPVDISNPENLQPGDLLFFGRSPQRISHVGLYLGNDEFIHSSGRVHISSINPDSPKYVKTRNFVAARRIIGNVSSEGIDKVEKHQWYNLIHQ